MCMAGIVKTTGCKFLDHQCVHTRLAEIAIFFSSSFGGKIVSTMPMASFTPREARTNSGGAC